jgi:hypothetical protein
VPRGRAVLCWQRPFPAPPSPTCREGERVTGLYATKAGRCLDCPDKNCHRCASISGRCLECARWAAAAASPSRRVLHPTSSHALPSASIPSLLTRLLVALLHAFHCVQRLRAGGQQVCEVVSGRSCPPLGATEALPTLQGGVSQGSAVKEECFQGTLHNSPERHVPRCCTLTLCSSPRCSADAECITVCGAAVPPPPEPDPPQLLLCSRILLLLVAAAGMAAARHLRCPLTTLPAPLLLFPTAVQQERRRVHLL